MRCYSVESHCAAVKQIRQFGFELHIDALNQHSGDCAKGLEVSSVVLEHFEMFYNVVFVSLMALIVVGLVSSPHSLDGSQVRINIFRSLLQTY